MSDQKRTDKKTAIGEIDWNDLRYMLALSRHGSLSAAARALKVNHATVARRIAALEESLGVTLFERRARGYHATPQAEPILQAAEQVEAPLLRMERQAQFQGQSELQGNVRLTATEGIATYLIGPHLAEFRRLWPGIQLEIVVEHRALSLARREADLAFRWARPQSGELYCRKLGDVAYRLYRSRMMPAGESAVASFDDSLNDLPESRWLARQSNLRPVIRSNSMHPLLAAVRAGACAALLPDCIASGFTDLLPAAGKVPVVRELWIVLHRDLRQAPRVRKVADFFADKIKQALR